MLLFCLTDSLFTQLNLRSMNINKASKHKSLMFKYYILSLLFYLSSCIIVTPLRASLTSVYCDLSIWKESNLKDQFMSVRSHKLLQWTSYLHVRQQELHKPLQSKVLTLWNNVHGMHIWQFARFFSLPYLECERRI